MVLNSYIKYKENILIGSKPMSRLDCTVNIVDALSEEWLHKKKNSAAGILGT
jgi:hypothetical protein